MKNYRNILFIGNSLTFYNNLPRLFEELSRKEGEMPYVESITKGKWRLIWFADPNDEMGALVEQALSTKHYDLVILQDQSHFPVTHYDDFFGAVKKLRERIPADTDCLLYQTWGYHPGLPELEEFGFTQHSMTVKLCEAYRKAGKELGIPVSPVGTAFGRLNQTTPDDPMLYLPDNRHPSQAGSYLAALCLYGSIYGFTPAEVEFIPEFLEPETAAILKKAAADALKRPVLS